MSFFLSSQLLAVKDAGAAEGQTDLLAGGVIQRPLAAGTQKETPAYGWCFFLSCIDKKDADPGVKQNREPAQYPQGAGRQQEVLS